MNLDVLGVHLEASADSLLNSINQYGLPHCSSLEIVSLTVLDPNGNTFANQGVYLP